MDFKSESNKELVLDTVNKKIQKNIFDIIFQHLQDMVYVMKVEEGPSFRYLFVNEAGLKKANLPLDVIGKTMIEALPYEFAINLQKNYQKLLQKKEIIFFDDVFYFEDGRKIYGETILTPIFNEEKRISYVQLQEMLQHGRLRKIR